MDEYTESIRFFKESDVYLIPYCLLVIYLVVYFVKKKYAKTEIEKYFLPALQLRLAFVVIYALVVWYYYGYGDTAMYYRGVLDMHNAVSDNISYLGDILLSNKLDLDNPVASYFVYDGSGYLHYYMRTASNYSVSRFSFIFSLLFFRSYICISFCLCFYSFAGCWRIFKMFYEMYPVLHKKFAVAFLFLPSVLFWGGSLLKDSICMGSMGFGLYALYQIFFKKRKIFTSLIILVLAFGILFYIKPYILLCLVPSFLVWLFVQFRNKIQDTTLRMVAGILLGVVSITVGILALRILTTSEMAAQYSSDKILSTVQGVQGVFVSGEEGSGSAFNLGTTASTPLDMLKLFPLGVVSTLFRPFLWEAGNPLMIFSALESFCFLILTVMAFRRIGFKRFFSIAFADPVVIFCMIFSITFAGIIGITTTNFGALARYKIPCIPFYLIMLFIIMHKSGKFSPNIIFSRKLF